jgi:hypothetical protein
MRRIHRRVHLNVLYVTVRSVPLGDHELPGDHMGSKSNNSHTRPIADPFGVQGGVTIRTRSQPESNSMISIVHPAELSSETQQTPGSLRMSAMRQCKASSPHYGRAYLWLSLQRRPASTTMASRTPSFTSLGERLLCDGATSRNFVTVSAGDFLHVPSWLPHRELNPSQEDPFRWVVVRSTPEPIVVNLPDDFWTPTDQKQIEIERRRR